MVTLRDYQQELSDKAMQAIAAGENPIVCAPCGAGKSYIMRDMAKRTDGNVLIVAHRRELLRQHEEVFAALPNVRLESIFTEARRLGQREVPKLILCDEAHLSEASSYLKVFQFYGCPVAGFTATPTRLDGKSLSAYTTIIHNVCADDLISKNMLAHYKYFAPTLYDMSKASTSYGDYTKADLEEVVLKSSLYGNVLKTYRNLADGAQAIAYCATVKHSEAVADAFSAAGIPAVHIDAQSSPVEREAALGAFRSGKIRILCNVNLISEGISIPECSVILGLRPTMSRALYVQQMCRALRYAPGKEAILIDFCGNIHRHGMPTADYKYELTPEENHACEFNADGDFNVRVCQECFRTLAAGTTQCPYCGAVYQPHPREIARHEEIALQEIKAAEAVYEALRKERFHEDVRAARSYADLLKIAQKNNYKKGWAYMMAKQRGYIR